MSVIADRYSFMSATNAFGVVSAIEEADDGEEKRDVAHFAAECRQLVRRQHLVDDLRGEIKPEAVAEEPFFLVGDDEAIADRRRQRGEPGKKRLDEWQRQGLGVIGLVGGDLRP